MSLLRYSAANGTAAATAVLLLVIALPAACAGWAAWVVARAGVPWLTVGTLVILAGFPFLLSAMAGMNAKSSSAVFGRGFEPLLASLGGAVVTVLALGVFSVCALVAAGVIGATGRRRM